MLTSLVHGPAKFQQMEPGWDYFPFRCPGIWNVSGIYPVNPQGWWFTAPFLMHPSPSFLPHPDFVSLNLEHFSFHFLRSLLIISSETTDGESQTESFGYVHKKEFCKQTASISKHWDGFPSGSSLPTQSTGNWRQPSHRKIGFLAGAGGFFHLVNFSEQWSWW